jgi:Na+/H+ antiporter NhaA
MVWANSPWGSAYVAVRDARFGPASLHLDLTVGQWAADGLLAIFFSSRLSGLRTSLLDPIAVGIVVGLVAGKTIGILGGQQASVLSYVGGLSCPSRHAMTSRRSPG